MSESDDSLLRSLRGRLLLLGVPDRVLFRTITSIQSGQNWGWLDD